VFIKPPMIEAKKERYNIHFMRPIFAIVLVSACIMAGALPVAEAKDAQVGEVDISKVPDGTYVGGWLDYGDVPVVVEVAVKKGRIEGIKIIESKGDQYVQDAGAIIEDVIEAQSVKLDAVTGATITSDAILRAIEDALRKGSGSKIFREKR
jgi:uncharacterized protein with FMN-binding domain